MIDLTSLNTLKVPAKAKDLVEINTLVELKKISVSEPYMFLGSGANVLFVQDFPGTIIKINLKGTKIVSETSDSVQVEIAAGEPWHNLVTWAVEKNLSGIENMALIPGTVGAAAVGNIAAYGQNFTDVFVSLKAYEISTQTIKVFTPTECQFGYRESIFKHELKNKFLVTSVVLKLSKTAHLELSYHASRHQSLLPKISELKKNEGPISIKDVFNAVVALRTEKLPDWHTTPNAGSFFKNPIVTHERANKIKSQIPDLQMYPADKLSYQDPSEAEKYVKLPAGMLLDFLGWKGKRMGNVGTSPNHALVVINYGATGAEIYTFSESMRADVKNNFDLDLEYEVKII